MRFFFYGTLLAGSGNAVARAVHARLCELGPAVVSATLYGVPDPQGWFPALIAGEGVVKGRLYETGPGFGAADLARLDAYENFDPARPERSLYIREEFAVTGADGRCSEAQAYRFAQPLPAGSRAIEAGDFRAWLAGEGLGEFEGLRD